MYVSGTVKGVGPFRIKLSKDPLKQADIQLTKAIYEAKWNNLERALYALGVARAVAHHIKDPQDRADMIRWIDQERNTLI